MKSPLLSLLLFILSTSAFAQNQMLTNNPSNQMTDYVAVGNMGTFPNQGTVSFALRASVVENYRNVLTTGCISDCNTGIRFEELNDGSLHYDIGDDGTGFTGAPILTPGNFLPNVWRHVALVWDKPANNVKTYVDGILKTDLSCTFWPTQLGNVNIGVGWGLSRKFAGNLEDVTLWTKALTLSEIQALSAGTVNASDPDLKGYWNFDGNTTNGAGQTVLNQATNFSGQYNGTTVGTASTPVFETSTWTPTPPPPPPTISSISPTSGHAGASATVTGTNLNSGTVTVTVGGIAVTNVSVLSATQVSFNTPVTGEGTDQEVIVTVSGQASTGMVTYDYILWDIHSVSSGLWHNASTWDCNCVPNQSDTITIEVGHTISEDCYCPHTVSGVMVINGTLNATYGFTATSTAKVSGAGTLEGSGCNCPTAVINTSNYSVQNTNNNVQFNQPVSIQNYTMETNSGGLYGATVTINGTFTYFEHPGLQGVWAPLVIASGATMNLTSYYPNGGFAIRNGMTNNGTVNMISGAGMNGNNGSGTNPTIVNNGTWNQDVNCTYTQFIFENNGAFNMNGTGLSDMVSSNPSYQSTFHNNANGTLKVTSGTLNMGPFTNAGTVQGNGTLQYSAAVTNTGHFAPGLSPGKLDIEGDFTNAILDIEIVAGSPAQKDSLNVTGNLVLTGSTLNVTAAQCPADGDYDIVTYTGTRTDDFTNLTLPTGFSITYDDGAKKVVLVVDGCEIDPDNDGDNFTINEGDCDDDDPDEFPGQTWYIDADGDDYGGAAVTQCLRPTNGFLLSDLASGSSGTDDCDDGNNARHPGATETCNGADDNCNGQTDEGVTLTFYADADGDGYGDAAATTQACSAPSGYVSNSTDCNDNPAAGGANEYPGQIWYIDADGDDYGGSSVTQCARPTNGYLLSELASGSTGTDDCDDGNNARHPGATETCNGADDNCNGQTDEGVLTTFYADADGDGYGDAAATTQACSAPSGYVSNSTDCNDNPAAGGANEYPGQIWYIDADGDDYGGSSVTQCARPTNGYLLSELASGSTGTDDCDDGNNARHPGATETCNGADDNCNGQTDEGVLTTFYADADGDGYGYAAATTQACSAPSGYVSNSTDCNDNPAAGGANEYPGQTWYIDADGDDYGGSSVTQCARPANGYLLSELASGSTGTDDCDDGNNARHPGATEICNGADDNCNGQTDEGVTLTFYADADGDGYGDAAATTQACSAPSGYVSNSTDCNDNPAAGGANEYPGQTWYIDADGDDYGGSSVTQCARPTNGYLLSELAAGSTGTDDCDDGNNARHPGATETCNGADDNCNGQTDEGVPQHPDYAALMAIYTATGGANWTNNTGWGTTPCDVCTWYGVNCTDGRVTQLYLDNNHLVGTLPTEIGNLSTLRYIGMQINQLTGSIPASIGNLSTLFGLDLNVNQLTGSIPASIGNISTLLSLNAYNNQLSGNLPLELGNLTNLLSFQVANNQLSGCFPTSYTEFCSGTYVSMSGNPGLPGGGDFDAFCSAGAGECVTDVDGDGYSIPDDCDDNNDIIHPDATEICDGLDNDCDGQTDEGVLTTFYADADGDTYGNPSVSQMACTAPPGYVSSNTDCNDNPATDGANEFPGQTWYIDTDGDDYGGSSVTQCLRPANGYLLSELAAGSTGTDDCDDSNNAKHPGATEICNNLDDNCNGQIDEGVTPPPKTWTGATNTDWNTPSNWSCNTLPVATDDVTIPNVTNDPVIMGGTAAVAKSVTVSAGGLLTVNATGSLTINGATTQGLLNHGTVENSGNIVIGSVTSGGQVGLSNQGTFNNNVGAEIRIDRSTYTGLANSGTFINIAKVIIGAVAGVGYNGFHNSNTFNNNTGGDIRIDRCTGYGLWNINYSGIFTNAAKITIGALASVGSTGLYNSTIATFNNNAGGEISIDRADYSGLYNSGTLTNAAKITIGGLVGSFQYGIVNNPQGYAYMGIFQNNTGGEISITRTFVSGILNTAGASFTNKALLTIGANGLISGYGIENIASSTFLNDNCATLLLFRNLSNYSTFTNNGLFSVNTTYPHFNSGIVNNGILSYPQGNPIPNVINNDLIVRAIFGAATIPNALQKGGALSFTAASTWYSDPALTTPAGTYNQAANTFTPAGSLPQCTVQTLYFNVTDDVNGCTRLVSIRVSYDAVVPSIVCPQNINRSTDANQCNALVTYVNPTFSDNCAGATMQRTSGQASGTTFAVGTHSVNWQVTDVAGNTAVCNFTITVNDAQAPSITCPASIARNTDTNLCTAVVTYNNPTFSDNCVGAGIVRTGGLASSSVFPKGQNTVTWQATDATGLTRTCSFTVTVNDNQLPTIACPSNMTQPADAGLCTAVVNYSTPTFTDNCAGGSVVIQSGLPSGSVFPKGQTTVVWRATDAAGLFRTCSFRVTVTDTQLPTITCPASQSLSTAPNLCTTIATYTTPTAADNCTPAPTVFRIGGLPSGANFPKGTNVVTWRAIDGAGLSRSCSFTITVTDQQAPSITCPANISVTAEPGQCSSGVTYATPTSTDNCGIQSQYLLSGPLSGATFSQGVTTVTWRALDNSGMSNTCAFTVTVSCGTSSGPMNEQLSTLTRGKTQSNLDLQVAPNPATDEVQIWVENAMPQVPLASERGELTMFDMRGRAVHHQSFVMQGERASVNLSEFPAGLYLVVLRMDGAVLTKRLVVSRL